MIWNNIFFSDDLDDIKNDVKLLETAKSNIFVEKLMDPKFFQDISTHDFKRAWTPFSICGNDDDDSGDANPLEDDLGIPSNAEMRESYDSEIIPPSVGDKTDDLFDALENNDEEAEVANALNALTEARYLFFSFFFH